MVGKKIGTLHHSASIASIEETSVAPVPNSDYSMSLHDLVIELYQSESLEFTSWDWSKIWSIVSLLWHLPPSVISSNLVTLAQSHTACQSWLSRVYCILSNCCSRSKRNRLVFKGTGNMRPHPVNLLCVAWQPPVTPIIVTTQEIHWYTKVTDLFSLFPLHLINQRHQTTSAPCSSHHHLEPTTQPSLLCVFSANIFSNPSSPPETASSSNTPHAMPFPIRLDEVCLWYAYCTTLIWLLFNVSLDATTLISTNQNTHMLPPEVVSA